MKKPAFSFLVCPDSRLARLELRRQLQSCPAVFSVGLASGLGDSSPESVIHGWREQVYWADEDLPSAFWENLTLQGLFSSPKALVLRNAQALPAETWRKLSAALGSISSEVWPFLLLEVAFDKGNPKIPAHLQKMKCWEFAEKQGWNWVYPGLEPRNLPIFVRDEAKKRGISFAPGAFEAIIPRLPLDANALLLELDKLELAAQSSSNGSLIINKEQAALLAHESDMDIFSFIRAVQEGKNPAEVWRKINRDELSGESSVFSFLALLLREARTLWQLLNRESVALPPSIIPVKQRLAQSLGFEGLSMIWELCFEAERGIKSGERAPDQAYEALVAGLTSVFRGKTLAQV